MHISDNISANSPSQLSVLIGLLEHLNAPWGIKDAQSRHLYMNSAAYLYTDTPAHFSLEGKLDNEFPATWAEYADDMVEHDRLTQSAQDRVAVIETHYWFARPDLQPYLCEKIPLFGPDKAFTGVIWSARGLDTLSPLKYINKQKPSVLTTEANTSLFSRTELNTLFLLLQHHNTKEIARIYDLSPRTVEHHIYTLYQKADVHSFRQFEEYCRESGLDNYIPPHLLEKGIQFI